MYRFTIHEPTKALLVSQLILYAVIHHALVILLLGICK